MFELNGARYRILSKNNKNKLLKKKNINKERTVPCTMYTQFFKMAAHLMLNGGRHEC